MSRNIPQTTQNTRPESIWHDIAVALVCLGSGLVAVALMEIARQIFG